MSSVLIMSFEERCEGVTSRNVMSKQIKRLLLRGWVAQHNLGKKVSGVTSSLLFVSKITNPFTQITKAFPFNSLSVHLFSSLIHLKCLHLCFTFEIWAFPDELMSLSALRIQSPPKYSSELEMWLSHWHNFPESDSAMVPYGFCSGNQMSLTQIHIRWKTAVV